MERFGMESALDRRCRWIILLVGPIVLGIGCSPATLGFLLMPFTDNRIQPTFKLAQKNKEVTVVLLSDFAYREHRPDFLSFDRDLAERFAGHLRKRFQENKDKIKIVPQSQVRAYLAKQRDEDLFSKQELGRHFKADYVIAMEINSIGLHEKGSSNMLLRGALDMSVTVHDVHQPDGEGVVFEKENHQWLYPTPGAEDAGNVSIGFFRSKFLDHVARDLTRWFAAYPMEERHAMQ